MTIVIRGYGLSPGVDVSQESYVYSPGGATGFQLVPRTTDASQTDQVPDGEVATTLRPRPKSAKEE